MRPFLQKIRSRFFNRNVLKRVAILLVIVLSIQCAFLWWLFGLARQYLLVHDPRQLQNRSEMVLTFSPRQIAVGSKVTSREIKQYLNDLAYVETQDDIPGSFWQDQDGSIFIRSRMRDIFPYLKVGFEKNRLTSIELNGQSVRTATLEPLQLGTILEYADTASIKKEMRTRRTVIQPGTLPQLIADALTSAEDKAFFEHQGVDWLSVSLRPILSGGEQGGSGISQQLIKNNVIKGASDGFWQFGLSRLDPRLATIERKVGEIPMAVEVNRLFTKDEILAAYASMVPMGTSNGVDLQGLVAAAAEYFGTSIFDISDSANPTHLAHAATLAGMIQAPDAYLNFVRNGGKCPNGEKYCLNLVNRRNRILDLLQATHSVKYPASVVEQAKSLPLGITFQSRKKVDRPLQDESKSFASYAARQAISPGLPDLPDLHTQSGRLVLMTTLDAQMQRAAVDVVKMAVPTIQKKVDATMGSQRKSNELAFEKLEYECRARNKGNDQLCQDLFKARVSLVAVDSKNGAVLAMTMGSSLDSKRSPGSAVKPFYYLRAIENGTINGQVFTAATILSAKSDSYLLKGQRCADSNLGGTGSVRQQLAYSWNFGACIAAESTGLPVDFVGMLTHSHPEKSEMSSIGGSRGSEVSLVDLVQAYTIFPNNGKMVDLRAIDDWYLVDQGQARPIRLAKYAARQVADPAATFITTQIMRSVVADGTAAGTQKLSGIQSPALAGKTGSGMVADLWFIGLTPRIVVGVWVGMPNNLPRLKLSDGFSGGKVCAPIAAAFLRRLKALRPELVSGEFEQPPGVITTAVNPARGCIAESGGRKEYFMAGRLPPVCS